MNTQDPSFRMDWLDFLAVQGTLKSLLQHHNFKASFLQCSAFLMVQLLHPYMTTGKTIAVTKWTFVGKVMSLLFNTLCRFVIVFLPRSKHLLISWLQSPSAVILEPNKIKSVTATTFSPSTYILTEIHLNCQHRMEEITSLTLFSWAPKSLQMVTAAIKLKDAFFSEGKL